MYTPPYTLTGAVAAVSLALTGCWTPHGHGDHAMASHAGGALHAPKITRLGAGPRLAFPGHDTNTLVGPRDTLAGLALLELTVPPRAVGAPPHVHSREDEYFFVVSGELAFLQGEQVVRAPAGTLAALTRGHLHAFWNPGSAPARVLLAVAPGDFEGSFDEVAMALRADGARDPAEVGRIVGERAAARGVQIFPGRLPAEAAALLPR